MSLYSTYLPLIRHRHCLPTLDEICQRCVNFIYGYMNCGSCLIKSKISYGIFYGHGHSLIGRNITFCLYRYNCSITDFTLGSLRYIIDNSYNASVREKIQHKVTFIEECIYNRDLLSKRYFKTILSIQHYIANLQISVYVLVKLHLYICTNKYLIHYADSPPTHQCAK
jgi:hypothetical protein